MTLQSNQKVVLGQRSALRKKCDFDEPLNNNVVVNSQMGPLRLPNANKANRIWDRKIW